MTVTDVLTDYIQRCTDNDRTEYAVNTGNDSTVITDNYDTDKLNDVVNTAIDTALSTRNNSAGLTHQEVRDIAAATIKDSIAFERLCDEAAVIKIAAKLVNAAFNPLSQAIAKLKAPGADIEQLVQAQTELEPPTPDAPESNGEPTELSYRDFCNHYEIKVPDGTPNQPKSSVVQEVIAKVEAQGHFGWVWKSERKRLIRMI